MATIRVDEPTPNGGAYSIGHYMNENGDDCTPEEATVIHINEYAEDGTFICNTIGDCKEHAEPMS